VVVLPTAFDGNGDHRVTNWMVREALKKNAVVPHTMYYLVHYRSRKTFPLPYGYHPSAFLQAPPPLLTPIPYDLSSDTMKIKEAAVSQHRSQIALKDGFLLSFVRRNELYWREN